MMDPARRVLAALALLNLRAMVLFLLLLKVAPIRTDLDVRERFVQLDRAGVVNQDALQKFDPSYGFSAPGLEFRKSVPRYVAGPALLAEKINAGLGLLIAGCNTIVAGGGWLWCRFRRRAALASMSRFLVAVILLCFAAGCLSSPSPRNEWPEMYRDCVASMNFIGEGGKTKAHFTFSDTCEKSQLAQRIKRNLERSSPGSKASKEWPYRGMKLATPPISEREFWAMALGVLIDRPFAVRYFESDEQREADLQRFLKSIP